MTEKEIQPIALDGKIIDFKTKEVIEDLDMKKNKKRFTICVDSNNLKSLWDDERTEEEPLLWLTLSDRIGGIDNVCELLNELNDEKKLLKKQLGYRIALSQDYNNECDELFDENQELKEENEQLKQQLKEFKDYVFSDDEILCYSCVNCISKGIYEVECSVKGKVDVHGKCFSYWKDEVESRSD